jgi:Domain of unknown function (DUF1924)
VITSKKYFIIVVALGFSTQLSPAFAGTTPGAIVATFAAQAKVANPAFKEFSGENGHKFFLAEAKDKKGETLSCAGCHTKDPTKDGKTRAGKAIKPMAVSANSERFTDKAKVDKWFKRNCNDVYARECTPQEKGDFITYMINAK